MSAPSTTPDRRDTAESLRRTVRDLVAMSTLPAVWSRSGVVAIAESLAELMVKTLGLELVYIRAPGSQPGEFVEAASRRDRAVPASRLKALGKTLAPLMEAESPRSGNAIVNPLGSGHLYPALVHFGTPDERGSVFAGSLDPSFPTTHDRLILGVSVNLMGLMQQRSRAETALRDSERRYAMVTELLPQLVWTTDASGSTVEFVNKRWIEYTGLTLDQMKKGASAVHPDDLPRAQAAWARAIKDGRQYEMEYRLRAAQGYYEWFLVQGLPDYDEKGKIRKWYGSCTNIDAQRRSRQR